MSVSEQKKKTGHAEASKKSGVSSFDNNIDGGGTGVTGRGGRPLSECKALDEDDKEQNDDLPKLTGPITLNVGGTSLVTLSRFSESVLCKMFEGAFSLKSEKDGSYFIDRDGQTFRYNVLHTQHAWSHCIFTL